MNTNKFVLNALLSIYQKAISGDMPIDANGICYQVKFFDAYSHKTMKEANAHSIECERLLQSTFVSLGYDSDYPVERSIRGISASHFHCNNKWESNALSARLLLLEQLIKELSNEQ